MPLDILMIEDNEQNRYLARFLLEGAGHKVTSANDGLSGIELASSRRFDVILLDIQLPGMDGYDVARSLRQLGPAVAPPIVAVTSYAMPGDRERALAAGCDGYIEKPIDPENFVNEIEAWQRLGHREQPTQ